MALKERKVLGKVTINHKTGGHCEVQEVIEIYDDVTGEIRSSNFHRCVIDPGDDVAAAKIGVDHITKSSWTSKMRTDFSDKKKAERLKADTEAAASRKTAAANKDVVLKRPVTTK